MSAQHEAWKAREVVPRKLIPCPGCYGSGWIETGFAFGTNVGDGRRCVQCGGSGKVWVDDKPKGEA